MLAIDDLHWADAPSLRYLADLLARVEGTPITVLLARRPREPGGRSGLLEWVGPGDGAGLIEIRPLVGPPLSNWSAWC